MPFGRIQKLYIDFIFLDMQPGIYKLYFLNEKPSWKLKVLYDFFLSTTNEDTKEMHLFIIFTVLALIFP